MFAHIPSSPRLSKPAGIGQAHPPRRPGASPITHPGTSDRHIADCTCPCCEEAQRAFLALDRLGAYLESEGSSLADLLDLFALSGARSDFAILQDLHIEPRSERAALAEAAMHLGRLLEDLRSIPCDAPESCPTEAHVGLMREFDARIRWLGARTEDMLSVLKRALE